MTYLVQLILRILYYYSRFFGVINFEIDLRTGLARSTNRAMILSALANLIIFSVIPLLVVSELLHLLWMNAGLLHQYIVLVLLGMRVGTVVATILSRWLQRQRLVRLVNDFRRLTRRTPQVIELLQMISGYLTIQASLNVNLILSILVLHMLIAVVNVLISHYYFAILNIHLHYTLLNQELSSILMETQSLEFEDHRAAFMTKCCCLADRLEAVAKYQHEIQSLADRLIHIFGIQGFCISSTSYISMIGTIYFTFSAIRENNDVLSNLPIYALYIVEISSYFVDVGVTVNNMISLLDDHAKMLKLLEQYTAFAWRLDERLELVYESFQLQVARNPQRISILNIFDMDRSQVISMWSSIITHSLVLIQYELKNA